MNKKITGIGVAALPDNIRQSKILTATDIDLLASVDELPFVDPAYYDERLKNIFQYYSINPEEMEKELQLYARELLGNGNLNAAWQVLLSVS